MASSDKAKKRIQLWKKAAIHFTLCFVAGFFTGFAPTTTIAASSLFSPQPPKPSPKSTENSTLNRILISQSQSLHIASSPKVTDISTEEHTHSTHLLIIVTAIGAGDALHGPLLMRLAHTLRLVPAPLLWVVVEAQNDALNTEEMLRRSGIMYRHVTYRENFTDADTEADFRRNLALNHVEYHRLDGIIHFADVYNSYDLQFFDELRGIDVFGAWPMVMVSANRRRVAIEGPVCISSMVVGWRMKDSSNGSNNGSVSSMFNGESTMNESNESGSTNKINISGFAFNSSVLWDPERWGRSSSLLDTSQDSMKFVQEVVLEDESKLTAIPSDCSKIMLWHLQEPRALTPTPNSQYQN